jgi:hypothetical protein
MDIIYRKKMSLYDDLFLKEYLRVSELTKELNRNIGFPMYKIIIDAFNSELRVENKFQKHRKVKFRNSIKGDLNYVR